MKRLREQFRDMKAPSPLGEKARALIESVDPVPESHERMLRVRRELDRPRGAVAAAMRLPALAMATLVVLFGASAFAAVRIYVAVTHAPPPPPAITAPPEPAHRIARKHRVAVQQPKALPAADPAQAVEDWLPDVDLSPLPASHSDSGTAPALRGGASEPRVRAKSQQKARSAAIRDSELVHRAVQALRRDHDPALAARLLDENRARNPRGPLAEEALSLQIEAALELGAPRARSLAGEYVVRYPNGRYLHVARRALGEAAP